MPNEGVDATRSQAPALTPDGRRRQIGLRDADAFDEQLIAAAWLARASEEIDPKSQSGPYLRAAMDLLKSIPFDERFKVDRPSRHDDMSHAGLLLLMRIGAGSKTLRDQWDAALWQRLERWITLAPSPGGLRLAPEAAKEGLGGAMRCAALALLYADQTENAERRDRARQFAQAQMDYTVGHNAAQFSFVVGLGSKWPLSPRHPGAHAAWGGLDSLNPKRPEYYPRARHILYGALVQGPEANDTYRDVFDVAYNRVGLDLNATLQLALAGLIALAPDQYAVLPDSDFPPSEERNASLDWHDTDREFFVEARLASEDERSVRIEAYLNNRSRWPPRATEKLSMRYFFRVKSDVKPEDVRVKLLGSQGGRLGRVARWTQDVYYLEADFSGQTLLPNRIYQASSRPGKSGYPDDLYRRSIDFEIGVIEGKMWDRHDDWSSADMNDQMAIRPRIAVYDNGHLVGGEEPPL